MLAAGLHVRLFGGVIRPLVGDVGALPGQEGFVAVSLAGFDAIAQFGERERAGRGEWLGMAGGHRELR
jgi:hypothetical protein